MAFDDTPRDDGGGEPHDHDPHDPPDNLLDAIRVSIDMTAACNGYCKPCTLRKFVCNELARMMAFDIALGSARGGGVHALFEEHMYGTVKDIMTEASELLKDAENNGLAKAVAEIVQEEGNDATKH